MDRSLQNQLKDFKAKQFSTASVTQHKPQGNTSLPISKGSAFVSRSNVGYNKQDAGASAIRKTITLNPRAPMNPNWSMVDQ